MTFTIQRHNSLPEVTSKLSSCKLNHARENSCVDICNNTYDCNAIKPLLTTNSSVLQSNEFSPEIQEDSALEVLPPRKNRRLILKTGDTNISLGNVEKKRRRFLGDIFTTLLDMKWRYVLFLFAVTFFASWIFFGLIWWLILYVHEDHLHHDEEGWEPCMSQVYDWRTSLLFSIESQHTIGYGFRGMESNCPVAMIVLMIQSCAGVFIQSLITGIVFAKLLRPKRRANTLTFSKNAVICQRDGQYVLLFRVADMRAKSHIVSTTIRCVFVQNRITQEGEMISLAQQPLEVQAENAVDYYVFLVWPTTVTHVINESSPLWNMSAESLHSIEHFEIIVYLEGTVESTGMTAQVRTSFLPDEILWGHRLEPLVTYQKYDGQYRVDYTHFHATAPIMTMPECSAKEFDQMSSSDAGVTAHPRLRSRRAGLIHNLSDSELDHRSPKIELNDKEINSSDSEDPEEKTISRRLSNIFKPEIFPNKRKNDLLFLKRRNSSIPNNSRRKSSSISARSIENSAKC